jgi:hypothetical protein
MPRREYATIRFARWAGDPNEALKFFRFLIEPIIKRPLRLVTDQSLNVDIEISSVYGEPGPTDLLSKLTRLVHSKTPGGVPFGSWAKGFNLQPNKKARVNIFFTGENERPPFGDWDAYLSFDLHSYQGKNAYLPLWWITCTDIAGPNRAPYLDEPISVELLMKKREVDFHKRRKFCVAFIGKAYPFRMQALNLISSIENVEVYGAIARKDTRSKFQASKDFRFVFAFENDLFPGYVTEKVIEAWATGAIPLYWGSDPLNYINSEAVINLNDFSNFPEFLARITEVNSNSSLWEQIASQPILRTKPDLSEVNAVLKRGLEVLM